MSVCLHDGGLPPVVTGSDEVFAARHLRGPGPKVVQSVVRDAMRVAFDDDADSLGGRSLQRTCRMIGVRRPHTTPRAAFDQHQYPHVLQGRPCLDDRLDALVDVLKEFR